MDLNIMTTATGEKAREPYNITLEDFWRTYLRLLYPIGQHVNGREEDVLSYILSRPSGINYFKSPDNKDMKRKLRLPASEVTRLMQSLQRKRIVGDDGLPVNALTNMQKFISRGEDITFVFPLHVI